MGEPFFYFDYANHLSKVQFEQHYYCPLGEKSFPSPDEEQAKMLYFSILNDLEKKYGKGDGPEWWSKAWSFGSRVIWVSFSRVSDDGTFYNRGEVYASCVILKYYDLDANASSSDML